MIVAISEVFNMGKIREGKLLYHLTQLSNLDSIISHDLVPRSVLEQHGVFFSDVADSEIMRKRRAFGLDAYIPFHFHPYSSFDVAVKNSYDEDFVYICISRIFARSNGFLILPKHPLSAHEVILMEYDDGMDAIDWDAMERSSTESEYIKNVRMAECLTQDPIPVTSFISIAVKDMETKRVVEEKLQYIPGQKPFVNIMPWFNI